MRALWSTLKIATRLICYLGTNLGILGPRKAKEPVPDRRGIGELTQSFRIGRESERLSRRFAHHRTMGYMDRRASYLEYSTHPYEPKVAGQDDGPIRVRPKKRVLETPSSRDFPTHSDVFPFIYNVALVPLIRNSLKCTPTARSRLEELIFRIDGNLERLDNQYGN